MYVCRIIRTNAPGHALRILSSSLGNCVFGCSTRSSRWSMDGYVDPFLYFPFIATVTWWIQQRQTLSEVENLYFRHTHLTRPYPVISPGGRRNGRTLSSNSLSSTFPQQENHPFSSGSNTPNGSILHLCAPGSAGSSTTLRSNSSLTASCTS